MMVTSSTSPGKGEVGAQRRVGVARFNNTREKTATARKLRKAMTPAEGKLWSHLRNNNMHGLAFRRQHPMGAYVLDFYCAQAKLAVEVDGCQHNDEDHIEHDKIRDAWFADKAIRTLRFWNHDVLTNIENVLDTIWFAIEETHPTPSTPTPTLPLSGGGSKPEFSA
jgi:very-short-patch-repair endonuclease